MLGHDRHGVLEHTIHVARAAHEGRRQDDALAGVARVALGDGVGRSAVEVGAEARLIEAHIVELGRLALAIHVQTPLLEQPAPAMNHGKYRHRDLVRAVLLRAVRVDAYALLEEVGIKIRGRHVRVVLDAVLGGVLLHIAVPTDEIAVREEEPARDPTVDQRFSGTPRNHQFTVESALFPSILSIIVISPRVLDDSTR